MPEMPEVETIKNELLPHIIGRQITGVTLLWGRILRQPHLDEFRSRIIWRRITGTSRRGKYLILNLDSSDQLILHLKMSGSLLIKLESVKSDDKYTRAVFHLDNETAIHFRDPRKFGVIWLVKDEEEVVGELGPEPLESDFTPQILAERLNKRTTLIKALLCDQNFIAGMGNMYADEALFLSKIHPLKMGGNLSPKEISRLHHAIREVLKTAIDNKGASIADYYRPSGELGAAHFEFKVAHRRGENCPTCGTPIQRIAVRSRGTYFCPKCQTAN